MVGHLWPHEPLRVLVRRLVVQPPEGAHAVRSGAVPVAVLLKQAVSEGHGLGLHWGTDELVGWPEEITDRPTVVFPQAFGPRRPPA
jgi:hypothetical protein